MELTRNNRRLADRRPLPKDVAAVLTVGGQPYDGQLKDYSLKGFGMVVEEGAIKRLQRESSKVELSLGGRTFSGIVRHTRKEGLGSFLGIRTVDSDGQEISFTNDDPGWDLVEDTETIRTLFDDLAFKGPEAMIEVRQPSGRALAFAKKVTDSAIEMEVHATERGEIQASRAFFRFEIFQTAHAFEGEIATIDGQTFTVAMPPQLARLLRRETVRVPNGTNGVTLEVELASRLLGKAPREIRLVDFSEHGISVLDAEGWTHAPIGTEIERIRIRTPDGGEISGHGAICGHRWDREVSTYVTGLSFETDAYEDRTKWHNAILAARYPSLSFEYGASDHKPIWDLFDRAGYLDIKPRETLMHVVDVTKSTWEKLSNAGTGISKRILIKLEAETVGHLQMDRIYPRTWCAHHLAIDPKVSKLVGKEVYSVSTDVLTAEGSSFTFTMTNSQKPWNQRNYYDFIKQYRFPEHNELRLFEIYEIDTAKGWKLEKDPRVALRSANPYDLRRIARYFELYGTRLEREAFALDAANLDLARFHSELAPYGLHRAREFVVGTIDDRMVGFARVETGTTGVSIFGLLDMLYIHLIPDLGSDAPLIHETLVAAGLERFRDLGVRDVMIALDDNRSEHYSRRGLTYFMKGARWIAECKATNRYHAYSQMLYGHLLLRRDKIRQKHAAETD